MQTILLVADRQSVVDHVHTALAGRSINVLNHPDPETAATTAYAEGVDAVLVDMQVASMGAMAVTRAVRALADDGEGIPVTILLDRDADTFLAGRSGAKSWVSKTAPTSELLEALALAPTAS
ncbi:MAG: response regulator [Actinomycetota bacterium]